MTDGHGIFFSGDRHMIRGLYTSGWSMLANQKKLDTITNNLANVDTNGYKKDTFVFEAFPSVLTKRINDIKSTTNPNAVVGNMQLSSDVGEVFTYYGAGALERTGNDYDAAISDSGNSFFTVSVAGANGTQTRYYTRDGSFTTDTSGKLVTTDGNAVLGTKGPIILGKSSFEIESDGSVLQDGKVIDKLLMQSFTDTKTLRKFGNNLMETTPQSVTTAFSGKVIQGSVEKSNVNVIKEMVDMITVMRSYEANQKLIQAQDETLDKVVNEVGAVR
jgi:flagellar basal-body rod protein FlgF